MDNVREISLNDREGIWCTRERLTRDNGKKVSRVNCTNRQRQTMGYGGRTESSLRSASLFSVKTLAGSLIEKEEVIGEDENFKKEEIAWNCCLLPFSLLFRHT